MRRTILASVAATALTSGTLLVNAGPAQAADPAILYVKKGSATCSDTGSGTLEQPFCTIGAAVAVVTAGQTVDVGIGDYRENVTIARSGTPGQPITLRTSSGGAYIYGSTAGLVIDGQHDIRLENVQVLGAVDAPALDIRDASAITVVGGSYRMADTSSVPASTVPAVRLAGVTDSVLRRTQLYGQTVRAGLTMDAATSGVTVDGASVLTGLWFNTDPPSVGIQVSGQRNTVVNSTFSGFTGAAIAVEPGATGTVVASNDTSLDLGEFGLTARGQFDVVDAGSGRVALFARAAGKYVSAESTVAPVAIKKVTVGDTERFTMGRNADGSISLKSVATGRYLSIIAVDNRYLIANRTAIGPWERFFQVSTRNAYKSIKATINSRYVSAGDAVLIANRTTAGVWERFDVIDLGNGQVALFARANNYFVAAENYGKNPLQAGRQAVGSWERFTIVRNNDGTVSFKAAVNNRYVTAESRGTKPLIANRTAIGPWEKFTLG